MKKIEITPILLRVPEGVTIEELNEKFRIENSQLLTESDVIGMKGKEKDITNDLLLKADLVLNVLGESKRSDKIKILKIVDVLLCNSLI